MMLIYFCVLVDFTRDGYGEIREIRFLMFRRILVWMVQNKQ